jgi:vitamin B12 transporter
MPRAAIAALIVLAATFSARAQTPPMEIVVTALRPPAPVEEIPAGVSVIDRRAIETFAIADLAQALARVPGLRLAQSGGPGGNASVFVRGLNSSHVLVLRDGMPLNDAADASGAFNFGLDTLADVERIEIIRGPMAALYGSGAIGGVVNLVTRRGRAGDAPAAGEFTAGWPAEARGHAILSGAAAGWDWAGIGEGRAARGSDSVPQRMSVFRDVPQGFASATGTLHLGYEPREGTRFSALLRARKADFAFNALGFPIFDNANSSGRAEEFLGRLGATTRLLDGSLESGLFIGHQRGDRFYTQYLHPADPNQATNNSRYRGWRTDLQFNNTLHVTEHLNAAWLSNASLTFGYAYTADRAEARVRSSFFGAPYAQSVGAGMVTHALHAGLNATVLERLTLTAQTRRDAVQGHTPLTWRAGAVLALPELATRLHVATGTAFRAPSLFDRYGVDSFGYVGNPRLRPESARSWEAGTETDIAAAGRADFASVGVTYFDTRVRDLILVRFAPVYTSVNVGAVHARGVEARLALRPASWLTATLAYTYTDARETGSGAQLPRRPPHGFSATAMLTPLPGLSIAPEIFYTGAFRDYLIDNAGFPGGLGRSPGGLVFNLTATQALNPNASLFVTGRNLTFSRFEPVNGYQIPRTSVLAGVRLKL